MNAGRIQITPALALGEGELLFGFARAGGPGGQNVNKVATAVELRFDVARSPALSGPVRSRLIRLAGRRITREGVLVLHGRRFRTQEKNRQDVLDRLRDLIQRATEPPVPRRATRPTASSHQTRLNAKRRRGRTKQLRRTTLAAGDN